MSKIKFYEQILIDKIFQIRLTPQPVSHMSSDSVFLPSFAKDVSELDGIEIINLNEILILCIENLSLVVNSSLFDTMIMERLNFPLYYFYSIHNHFFKRYGYFKIFARLFVQSSSRRKF